MTSFIDAMSVVGVPTPPAASTGVATTRYAAPLASSATTIAPPLGVATSWIHGCGGGHPLPATGAMRGASAPQRTWPARDTRCARTSHPPPATVSRHAKMAPPAPSSSPTRSTKFALAFNENPEERRTPRLGDQSVAPVVS